MLQFVSVQGLLIYLQWFETSLLCFHARKKVSKIHQFSLFFRLTLHILLWHPKQGHLLNVLSFT